MIKLIVGLGNPGPQYQETRHNVGAWLVNQFAAKNNLSFKLESKFHGLVTVYQNGIEQCRLLLPTTYMNESGRSVVSVAKFYKIAPEEIVVAHDELDFAPGTVRLKFAGGHGGHNGLRDIIKAIGSKDFWRIRLGIGHPGHKDQVSDYVLHRPSKSDEKEIVYSIDEALRYLPELLDGKGEYVMGQLNTTG